ncbi:MAG: VOC family protein [Pseudomonadota bacterium]
MGVQLDHFIVPSRDKVAAARLLADILDVPWAPSSFGVFAPVFLNDGLTLDFIDTDEAFPVEHYCFRVDEDQFKAILGRLKALEIPWRSDVRGPVDMQVGTAFGGQNVYWNEPDGHQWEMLTVSYARQPPGSITDP